MLRHSYFYGNKARVDSKNGQLEQTFVLINLLLLIEFLLRLTRNARVFLTNKFYVYISINKINSNSQKKIILVNHIF